MHSRLKTMLVGIVAAALTSTSASAAPPTTQPIRLTFGPPGRPIPADFVGLSFETKRILARPYSANTLANTAAPPGNLPPRLFDSNDKPLVQFFRTLGVRSLRIGGNTADRASVPLPTTADIDALFRFAKATDLKVIYTLRLRDMKAYDMAEPATYIWQRYPDRLSHFEIGNEPDAYFKTYSEFQSSFVAYLKRLSKIAPGVAICGPSTTQGHSDWAADLAEDVKHSGETLHLVTQHLYPLGDGKKATDPAAAIDAMLSPDRHPGYQKLFDRFAVTVSKSGLGFRLEETNNFYNGGAPHASNSFASALWALDYMHWWAAHGADGVNFHSSDFFPETPDGKAVWYGAFAATANRQGYTALPLAYALMAFSLTRPARSIPVDVQPQPPELSAFATSSVDDQLYLTLINRSHGKNAKSLTVTLPTGLHAEGVISLTAPGVDSTDAIRLGGQPIDTAGNWAGAFRFTNETSLSVDSSMATLWRVVRSNPATNASPRASDGDPKAH